MASALALSRVSAVVAVGCCVPAAAGWVRTDGPALVLLGVAWVGAFGWGWLSESARDARGGGRDG